MSDLLEQLKEELSTVDIRLNCITEDISIKMRDATNLDARKMELLKRIRNLERLEE